MTTKPIQAYHNMLLLCSVILLLCSIFMVHDEMLSRIFNGILFTLVLFAATFTIQRNRKRLIMLALGVVLVRESSQFLFRNDYLDSLATLANVLFFLYIVIQLIRQVANSKIVSRIVILESINGYLLIGISGSILFALLSRIQEHAFAFSNTDGLRLADYLYYGFITQTTIGFGDITPVSDLARLLTITLGISGQLYIAIIIAMLVGKYLSQDRQHP